MNVTLVPNLGISSELWLLLTGLTVITLFFKFNRILSIRNLDLALLFVLVPGLMGMIPFDSPPWNTWWSYVWLLAGSSFLWIRCLCDLGLSRRPLLEPNLNVAGMGFLTAVMMGLLIAETVNLPLHHGAQRNPAETQERRAQASDTVWPNAPTVTPIGEPPSGLNPWKRPWHEISSRILAGTSHLALVVGICLIGTFHFRRTATGLAVATCYLLLPYTRIAVVDSGQLFAAALLIWALVIYDRPLGSGILIATAGAWLPPCLGVLPLWVSFQPNGKRLRFLIASGLTLSLVVFVGFAWPESAALARALGARSLESAGLWNGIESEDGDRPLDLPEPSPMESPAGTETRSNLTGAQSAADAPVDSNLANPKVSTHSVTSFWSGIDGSYRLPVLIAYVALVAITYVWPMEKDFSELIALNACLLIASQFWYMEHGGTLIMMYLPILLLMIFRPTLKTRRSTVQRGLEADRTAGLAR